MQSSPAGSESTTLVSGLVDSLQAWSSQASSLASSYLADFKAVSSQVDVPPPLQDLAVRIADQLGKRGWIQTDPDTVLLVLGATAGTLTILSVAKLATRTVGKPKKKRKHRMALEVQWDREKCVRAIATSREPELMGDSS